MSSEPITGGISRAGDTGISPFTDITGTLVSMQEIVGRKWQPIILYHLLDDGPLGFSALKREIDGISSKMLSESLDDLEAAGLVTREILSDKPVRVEYELTEAGAELEPLIAEMVRWGSTHDLTAPGDGSARRAATDGGRPGSE